MAPPITALVYMKAFSERVTGKNLRLLCGRPLCHWVLAALEQVPEVAEVVVNTDSGAIAAEARKFAKVTVHDRAPALRGNDMVSNQLIPWELERCGGEWFLQTHATNPLLAPETVSRGIREFFGGADGHDCLVGVTEFRKPFYRADGTPVNHDPQRLVPSQALEPVYEENSCLYLFCKAGFRRAGGRIGRRPLMFAVPPLESVDIDVEEDFTLAEALLEFRRRRNLV